MTRIFSSPIALPLAFALALTAAGGLAAFSHKADAANAPVPAAIHCFIGLKGDPASGPLSRGWVCIAEPAAPALTH